MQIRRSVFVGLVSLVAVLGASGSAAAEEAVPFKVIIHPQNPMASMSAADAAKLFLRTMTSWSNGWPVQPVDQTGASPIRAAFSRQVLNKTLTAVKAYWQQQIFSGRGVPPPEKASDAAVIAYVASTPGAVGYVSATAQLTGVKVLQVSALAAP